MGSGIYLRNAIEKYGIENFKKEILEVFDTPEMMFQYEAILVNEDFVLREDTYNLKQGGCGGFDYINNNRLNPCSVEHMSMMSKMGKEKAKAKLKYLRENDFEWVEEVSKNISKGLKTFYKNGGINAFKNKKHKEESKKKIGEKNSKNQKGEKNSQYGTMWIYHPDLKENKKIKKEDFPNWEQDGWLKGRKMKFKK